MSASPVSAQSRCYPDGMSDPGHIGASDYCGQRKLLDEGV